jgi:hypothetical protein
MKTIRSAISFLATGFQRVSGRAVKPRPRVRCGAWWRGWRFSADFPALRDGQAGLWRSPFRGAVDADQGVG